jgi:transcription elongation factor GreA
MTQATDQGKIWMTQDGYDKLKAELEHLQGPVRQEIIERISSSRDEGDLKENGGYHAAKEDQGRVEGRIKQLEEMLRRAEVGETPQDDGVVEHGMQVTIRFKGDDDTETFLLANRELEDSDIEVYSAESPMGKALLGARTGDTVAYEAPTGRTLEVEVVDAVPYTG